MKILYVGNFIFRHCTEVHIAKTLEDMGHEVVRHQEQRVGVIDEDELAESFDLVLWTRTWTGYVTHSFLHKCKTLSIPTASYHLDLYIGLKRQQYMDKDPFWHTDYVFTPDGDPHSAEVFKRKDINHYYMPAAVFKPEAVMGTPRKEYEHDVIFVGGVAGYHAEDWPYRRQLYEFLKKTYGKRMKAYGPPLTKPVRNLDLNDLYASAKVVVGDSLCQNFNHQNYWSDRVYETTGRGGFLIHPYIKGLRDHFTMDELVVYEYGNFNQLQDRIEYYLKDKAAREKIRLAGHERTKRDHTYHNRMASMFEVLA